jgi:hypothetical protein
VMGKWSNGRGPGQRGESYHTLYNIALYIPSMRLFFFLTIHIILCKSSNQPTTILRSFKSTGFARWASDLCRHLPTTHHDVNYHRRHHSPLYYRDGLVSKHWLWVRSRTHSVVHGRPCSKHPFETYEFGRQFHHSIPDNMLEKLNQTYNSSTRHPPVTLLAISLSVLKKIHTIVGSLFGSWNLATHGLNSS